MDRAIASLIAAAGLGWIACEIWRDVKRHLEFEARLAAADEVHRLDELRKNPPPTVEGAAS